MPKIIGSISRFAGLVDTPNNYVGHFGKVPAVNIAETAMEFIDFASASDKHYEFDQGVPASVWTITHNMGKFPAVSVVDSGGTIVEGQVDYVDNNNLTIKFTASFSGKAYLN
jgi:hypothetical protein